MGPPQLGAFQLPQMLSRQASIPTMPQMPSRQESISTMPQMPSRQESIPTMPQLPSRQKSISTMPQMPSRQESIPRMPQMPSMPKLPIQRPEQKGYTYIDDSELTPGLYNEIEDYDNVDLVPSSSPRLNSCKPSAEGALENGGSYPIAEEPHKAY